MAREFSSRDQAARGANFSQPQSEPVAPGSESPWVFYFGKTPQPSVRLFCFPYAGGDATTIFRGWPQLLPPAIQVAAVILPGRGRRNAEAPFRDIRLAAKAIADGLKPHLDMPFAFFGHSMGARICYETARLLKDETGIEPLHLFVSGSAAPHRRPSTPPTYNLPEAEFLQELHRLNGTPAEIFSHGELMNLLLPLLRADFEACQTYQYVPGAPLACPITAFGGLRDDSTREELEAWHRQTSGKFHLHMLPGDHFFINSEQKMLLRIVIARLMDFLSPGAMASRTRPVHQ